jgi:hypothetical protein
MAASAPQRGRPVGQRFVNNLLNSQVRIVPDQIQDSRMQDGSLETRCVCIRLRVTAGCEQRFASIVELGLMALWKRTHLPQGAWKGAPATRGPLSAEGSSVGPSELSHCAGGCQANPVRIEWTLAPAEGACCPTLPDGSGSEEGRLSAMG